LCVVDNQRRKRRRVYAIGNRDELNDRLSRTDTVQRSTSALPLVSLPQVWSAGEIGPLGTNNLIRLPRPAVERPLRGIKARPCFLLKIPSLALSASDGLITASISLADLATVLTCFHPLPIFFRDVPQVLPRRVLCSHIRSCFDNLCLCSSCRCSCSRSQRNPSNRRHSAPIHH
jgi:hypothetical protein